MKRTEKDPEFMAHRGYASLYPENTIEAVEAAAEAGITQIEFDVQLTRDGVPVVLHDASLQRTTGLKQSIFDTDAADLSDIEANYTELFGDACSGIRIPTLESMLGLLSGQPEWRFFVEIKRESIRHFGSTFVIDQLLPLIYGAPPSHVVCIDVCPPDPGRPGRMTIITNRTRPHRERWRSGALTYSVGPASSRKCGRSR